MSKPRHELEEDKHKGQVIVMILGPQASNMVELARRITAIMDEMYGVEKTHKRTTPGGYILTAPVKPKFYPITDDGD